MKKQSDPYFKTQYFENTEREVEGKRGERRGNEGEREAGREKQREKERPGDWIRETKASSLQTP